MDLPRTFYTFDERCNIAQRTSSTGAVANSDSYDAYGTRTGTVSQPDPWGYEAQAGYVTDTETGLILCTHRFYDPSTGRFLTRDPMGYGGGVNLYGYCGNDPANEADPSGNDPSFGGQDPVSTFPVPPGATGSPIKGVTIGIKGGGGSPVSVSVGDKGGSGGITVVYAPPINLQPPGTSGSTNGSISATGTINFGKNGFNGTVGGSSTLGGFGYGSNYGGGYNPSCGFGGSVSFGNTNNGKGWTPTTGITITDKPTNGVMISGTVTLTHGTLTGVVISVGNR